jgi:hypothetical protein
MLDTKIHFIAYPKGRYTKEILHETQKAGYAMGFSMDDDMISHKTNLFKVPRIGVDRTHTFEEFKTLFTTRSIAFRKVIKNSPLKRWV